MECTYLTYFLLFTLAVICLDFMFRILHGPKTNKVESDDLVEPPSPKSCWPIIGHLHLMARYNMPFRVFNEIAEDLGPIFQVVFGSTPCVVVSGFQNIREVLWTKGDHFDCRPTFYRFNQMFQGDKNNSLAFCDWSRLQQTRRELLRAHAFPKTSSDLYARLDRCLKTELAELVDNVDAMPDTGCVDLKAAMLHLCANVFTSYFCSVRFARSHPGHDDFVRNFDRIFYEVNNGLPCDYLPGLLPFYRLHFKNIRSWSSNIRAFMETEVIDSRRRRSGAAVRQSGAGPTDFVDTLLDEASQPDRDDGFDMGTGLYALEEMVGGHSAVANFLVKTLGFLVDRPDVQRCVQQEADAVIRRSGSIGLADRTRMPYTEAVLYESLRLINSPTVPHFANRDTSVNGVRIRKGTTVFLNNYSLHMSPTLWTNPEHFSPERFLNDENQFVKPEHFIPFSGGRRSCLGYKLVLLISFCTIGTLLSKYTLLPVEEVSYVVPRGHLALPFVTFPFRLRPRQ